MTCCAKGFDMPLLSHLTARHWARVASTSLCIVLASLLPSACARTGDTVGVSVSAINYTDQELNGFIFEQPGDETKVAGGVPVRPFQGAGQMCCFSLPAKWHPGIKVQLEYDWWQGADKPRQYITKEFEVPPYPDGQVGTLWALFYQDGSVEVVSSDFAPGHEKWPGKINGGPTPTLEYRRKVWQEDYDQEASLLPYYESLAKGPSEQQLIDAWKVMAERQSEKLGGFTGANDPKFREMLIERGKDGAISLRQQLAEMEMHKP